MKRPSLAAGGRSQGDTEYMNEKDARFGCRRQEIQGICMKRTPGLAAGDRRYRVHE